LVAQSVEQRFAGLPAVVLHEGFPSFRLRGLHPSQHVGREQRLRPVVAHRVAFGIEPAVIAKVFANLGLEVDFFVKTHAASF
jgi:hypothetical protein